MAERKVLHQTKIPEACRKDTRTHLIIGQRAQLYFLFLQEQIKGIIIILARLPVSVYDKTL
jgi:hypothetical protein